MCRKYAVQENELYFSAAIIPTHSCARALGNREYSSPAKYFTHREVARLTFSSKVQAHSRYTAIRIHRTQCHTAASDLPHTMGFTGNQAQNLCTQSSHRTIGATDNPYPVISAAQPLDITRQSPSTPAIPNRCPPILHIALAGNSCSPTTIFRSPRIRPSQPTLSATTARTAHICTQRRHSKQAGKR